MSAVIDMTTVPAPDVVEPLDYQTLLERNLAQLFEIAPEMEGLLESDPVYKYIEVSSYNEVRLRQRVNDAALELLLPYSTGSNLDCHGHCAGVPRQDAEPDGRYRHRIQSSPEGYSVAGPVGAYEFFAKSASPAVKDAHAGSPRPAEVEVVILSKDGDGTPDQSLLAAVLRAVSPDGVRPLTDFVQVVPAQIIRYQVSAELIFYPGPDAAVALSLARNALGEYIRAHHMLGHDITLSGLYAALHQPGVQRVELVAPSADIVVGKGQAAYCEAVAVTGGDVDV